MNINHTPGPWHTSIWRDEEHDPWQIEIEPPSVICSDYKAEALANARLIAAAPDLLAVCEAVEREVSAPMGDGGIDLNTLARLSAAIAKAKGGAK